MVAMDSACLERVCVQLASFLMAYPNEIGPGVFDSHSPRVSDVAEMRELLQFALSVLKPRQV